MKKLISVAFASISAFVSSAVHAALPTAQDVSTGSGVTNTATPVQFVGELFSTGTTTAATAVGGMAVLGVAWAVYSSFVESREKGDWKKFGVTASVGVVLVVGVVLMAILAVDYAS